MCRFLTQDVHHVPDADPGRVFRRRQHRAHDARVRARPESGCDGPAHDFRERGDPAPAALHAYDGRAVSVPSGLPDRCAVQEHERGTAGADARDQRLDQQLRFVREMQAHERDVQRVDAARGDDGARGRGDGAFRDQHADNPGGACARDPCEERAERDAAAHLCDDESSPVSDCAGDRDDASARATGTGSRGRLRLAAPCLAGVLRGWRGGRWV